MIAYLPHTEEDIKMMLEATGITDVEQLFADIPRELVLSKPLDIPEGIPEFDVYRRMRALAARNRVEPVGFLGCGSYEHIIPAAVGHVLSRSEFYTSYTPYQAEMSQGILQAIFEFQTMICELTGPPLEQSGVAPAARAAGVLRRGRVRGPARLARLLPARAGALIAAPRAPSTAAGQHPDLDLGHAERRDAVANTRRPRRGVHDEHELAHVVGHGADDVAGLLGGQQRFDGGCRFPATLRFA